MITVMGLGTAVLASMKGNNGLVLLTWPGFSALVSRGQSNDIQWGFGAL
jgi:hypothetical protein